MTYGLILTAATQFQLTLLLSQPPSARLSLFVVWFEHAPKDQKCPNLTSESREQVLNETAFATSMYEKLIWISAFMLVGARHSCTVGEVGTTMHSYTQHALILI